MSYRHIYTGFATMLLTLLAPAVLGQLPADSTTAELELQVAALTTLNELQLTSEQLVQFQAAAADTGAPAGRPGASAGGEHTSAQYHTALRLLRDAMAAGDDDKIDDAQTKVDDLRDGESITPIVDYPLTDAALKKARATARLLSSSEIAGYIALHADEVPDATDTIMDALDQCKDGTEDDFASLRSEAAEQVAMLAGGLDTPPGRTASQHVIELLNRAHRMNARQLEDHRPELERSARQITENIDSFEALHHWTVRQIAVLLSNPHLKEVLAERIKAASQG